MVGSRGLRSRAISLVLASGLLLVAAAGVVCVPASRAVAAPGAGNVAYGWGENDFYQVNGFNSAAYLASPVAAFGGGAGVTQVASGYLGSAVLHADGTVWT